MAFKASQILTKTIESDTANGLDAAVATFVQSLREQQLLDTHFLYISGRYVLLLVYSN